MSVQTTGSPTHLTCARWLRCHISIAWRGTNLPNNLSLAVRLSVYCSTVDYVKNCDLSSQLLVPQRFTAIVIPCKLVNILTCQIGKPQASKLLLELNRRVTPR